MNPQVLQVGAEFIAGLLTVRRQPAPRWPLFAGAGLAALIGLVFLAVAADLALEERFSPPAAAALVGGGLLVLGLLLAGVALQIGRRSARAQPADLPIEALIDLSTKLLGEAEGVVEAAPLTAALAALAAGCVVGVTTGRR